MYNNHTIILSTIFKTFLSYCMIQKFKTSNKYYSHKYINKETSEHHEINRLQSAVVSRTLVEPKIYFDELIEGPHY